MMIIIKLIKILPWPLTKNKSWRTKMTKTEILNVS